MKLSEITEGVTQVWSNSNKGKAVRKYRCTSGPRKGRVVAKPGTCNAPKRMSSSVTLKKSKNRRGTQIKFKTHRTKQHKSGGIRVAKLNKPNRRKPKSRRRKIK
jgi:hypothetical protein